VRNALESASEGAQERAIWCEGASERWAIFESDRLNSSLAHPACTFHDAIAMTLAAVAAAAVAAVAAVAAAAAAVVAVIVTVIGRVAVGAVKGAGA
jgi:hypothetical protein